MKKKPKPPARHHFVAQQLLRRFHNPNGKLFFYDKLSPKSGVRENSAGNLFLIKHLYSTLEDDGTRDPTLEKEFAALESRAEPLLIKLIDMARTGRPERLSPREREIWDLYFSSQWRRAPESFWATLAPAEFRASMEDAYKELEAEGHYISSEQWAMIRSEEFQARMLQNVMVDTMRRPMQKTLEVLRARGLALAVVDNPRKSFIVGSNPVAKLTSYGRTHLQLLDVEAWLAISHDVAVSPGLEAGTIKMFRATDAHVRHLNHAVFRQSRIVAGRSAELLASLARAR